MAGVLRSLLAYPGQVIDTDAIRIGDGTAALPALRRAGGTANSGLYFSGNSIAFSVQGGARWYIDEIDGAWKPMQGTNVLNIGSAALRPLKIFAGTSGIDSTGLIKVAGYQSVVVTKTAVYTATVNDEVILVDATAGAVTITLPAASNTGTRLHIEKIDASANVVTISRGGADTIEGAVTVTLTARYQSRLLVADGGTVWYRQASL